MNDIYELNKGILQCYQYVCIKLKDLIYTKNDRSYYKIQPYKNMISIYGMLWENATSHICLDISKYFLLLRCVST